MSYIVKKNVEDWNFFDIFFPTGVGVFMHRMCMLYWNILHEGNKYKYLLVALEFNHLILLEKSKQLGKLKKNQQKCFG